MSENPCNECATVCNYHVVYDTSALYQKYQEQVSKFNKLAKSMVEYGYVYEDIVKVGNVLNSNSFVEQVARRAIDRIE